VEQVCCVKKYTWVLKILKGNRCVLRAANGAEEVLYLSRLCQGRSIFKQVVPFKKKTGRLSIWVPNGCPASWRIFFSSVENVPKSTKTRPGMLLCGTILFELRNPNCSSFFPVNFTLKSIWTGLYVLVRVLVHYKYVLVLYKYASCRCRGLRTNNWWWWANLGIWDLSSHLRATNKRKIS
jgi:hypothetical protein